MSDYDSVLKDDKKYDDVEPIILKNKYMKDILIDLIAVFVVLFISYIVYYFTILTPKNVFIHDVDVLINTVSPILEPLGIDFNASNYSMEGTLSNEELNYKYEIIRDREKFKIFLSKSAEDNLTYYLNDKDPYVKFYNFKNENYIRSVFTPRANSFRSFRDNFDSYVTNKDFVKRFSLNGYHPIIEVNYVLDKNMINKLFGTNFIKDDINIIFTFKNDAITNNIIYCKAIVNNKTKNDRKVYTYKNGIFGLRDNNNKVTKYTLKFKNKDFDINITKDNERYSLFRGISKENGYQYSYQIINRIYNLNLNIVYGEKGNTYEFSSLIEKDKVTKEKKLTIVNQFKNDGALSENISYMVDYNKLSKEEKEEYEKRFDGLVSPIRGFIDEYKDSID